MPPTLAELWAFLPWGYAVTVLIETPVLLVGLSPHYRLRTRLAAGLWLTACTYPIVILVLPQLVWAPYGRGAYLAVAETFAPLAECALFLVAFASPADSRAPWRWSLGRDFGAIIVANLASFLMGEAVFRLYR